MDLPAVCRGGLRRWRAGFGVAARAVGAAFLVAVGGGLLVAFGSSSTGAAGRAPVIAERVDGAGFGRLEAVASGVFGFGDPTVAVDGGVWWTWPGLSRLDPRSGSVRTFTVADDPAFEYVGTIAPARAGGVWIVSPTGNAVGPVRPTVRRFDGTRFREVLGPGPVCNVAEAGDGTLWGSGCTAGVYRWTGKLWAAIPTPPGTGIGGGAITVDASGQVWVANMADKGAGVSRGSVSWTSYRRKSAGLPSDRLWSIAAAPDGAVWVGTTNGVARFLHGAWTAYRGAVTGVENVSSVAVTANRVWIGGWSGNRGRIARLEDGRWLPATRATGLASGGPHMNVAVAADGRGVVWGATEAGLFRFDGSRWRRVVRSGLQPALWKLAAAGTDELWTVSHPGQRWPGAWRLRRGVWTQFGRAQGMPATPATIAVAPNRVPWALTTAGVARFDGSRWQRVAPGKQQAIAFGADGSAWTASGAPVSTIRPIGGKALPGDVPLPAPVSLLAIGSPSEVWAACRNWYGGPPACERELAHFDGRAWRTVTLPGTARLALSDLELTAHGELWLSAMAPTGGNRSPLVVLRYRNGNWTTYRDADIGIRHDTPSQTSSGVLGTTPDGTVLLATGNGLFAFQNGSWNRIAKGAYQGLSVAPDGTIWLGGDGLFRLTHR